jgi:hypothetical protein
MMRRYTAWLLSVGLTVGGVALAPTAPPASAASKVCESSPARPDARSAAVEATRCGKRVEVLDQRSERSLTFAEADGSMSLESSAVPKRMKRGDGSWTDLDSTLRRQFDGTYAPAVAQTTARLTAGGDRTLVSVPTSAGPWQLLWPAVLPVARVAGDTATYPEVFPGVDLLVRALNDGFSYVLVVRTRAALRSAALRRIPMAATGPAVRAAGDHLEVVGGGGAAVLTSSVATAWDSSGPMSGVDGPGDGAKISQVGLGVQGADVVLTPDVNWLADPALTLPVYVDPQWSSGYQRWTYSNSANFSYSDLGGVARVGTNPDGTGGNWREHFEFPYSTMAGSIIKGVSFRSTLVHTASCGNVQADLWRSADVDVTGRTGWTPALFIQLGSGTGHAHKPSEGGGCAGDPQPDQVVTFSNGVNFLPQAQAWADQGLGRVTFTLGSHIEGNSSGWMKFSPSSTVFVVNYNRRPDTPDPAAMATVGTSQTVNCWTGVASGQPWLNVTNGVTFRANVTDSDTNPGGGHDLVIAKFEWQDVTTGTPLTAMPDTPGFESPPSAAHTYAVTVASGSLPAGHSFQWRVRGWDGQDFGNYSPWCAFGVDNGTPSQPVLASADLPAFPATPPAGTKVGRTALLTVSPGGGDTDIVGYLYSVTAVADPGMPTVYVPANANRTATIPVVPVASGLAKTFLSVVAVDTAGNRSPVALSAADAPGTRQFRANAADSTTHVANDATGDGRADVTVASDVGGGKSALWRWTSGPSGGLTAAVAPQGSTGTYSNGAFLTAPGDFDGDGLSDTAIFTPSGSTVVVSVQRSDRNQLLGTPTWPTMPGWSIGKMKVAGGDFNGDGEADLAVAYDMGSVNWSVYVLLSTSTPGAVSFAAPVPWYQYPANASDPSHVKFLAGDFNGDGRSDVAEFYDYGNAQTKLWVHWSQTNNTFSGAVLQWDSGPNAWFWSDSYFVAGDFTGDAKTDIAAIYAPNHTFNYTIALAMFSARTDGSGLGGPSTQWTSSANAFDWNKVVGYAGDYNGDGKSDLALLYRCCGAYQAQIWTSTSTGTALPAPVEAVNGGIGPAGIASMIIDTALGPNQARYQLVNAGAQTCAEVGSDNLLHGQPCSSSTAQYYTVERRGGQYVSIHPVGAPTQCVDVVFANTADTTAIQQTGCHGVATATYMLAQYWTIEYLSGPPSAATARLITPLSGKCFDLDNGRAVPNTTIWEYTCNGGTAQQWLLRAVA